MYKFRTDLAVEAKEISERPDGSQPQIDGVETLERESFGFRVTTVKILDDRGEKMLCKPKGTYITISLDDFIKRESEAFDRGVKCIAEQIRELAGFGKAQSVLIACLGNRGITPDAIGPEAARNLMATRHFKEKEPETFGQFREVSVLETGVLGNTGIESAEVIKSIAGRLKPDCIIVIDALASMNIDRVCRTIQITDTGIVPGSGVGNSRDEISARRLGVTTVAVGVPTVVDAVTLAANIAGNAGLPEESIERVTKEGGTMIVTPREIDARVAEISKLLGYGINMALHPGISIEDINMFVG